MATGVSTRGPSWEAAFSYLKRGDTIIGIDEVGRGAWAGPVTAAAVILPPNLQLPYLNDSKLLSPGRRQMLTRRIKRHAVSVGIGWASAGEVDMYGLTWAVKQSGLRALRSLEFPGSNYMVILDGRHNYLSGLHPSVALVKADAAVTPVSAASVVAKVARDRYMQAVARTFPGYGFEKHVGYGTRAHAEALATLGPSSAHRLSVRPVGRSIVTS